MYMLYLLCISHVPDLLVPQAIRPIYIKVTPLLGCVMFAQLSTIHTIIDGKNGSIIFPGKRRACQYQFMPDNTEDNSDIREAYEYEWHLFGNTQTYGKLFR